MKNEKTISVKSRMKVNHHKNVRTKRNDLQTLSAVQSAITNEQDQM